MNNKGIVDAIDKCLDDKDRNVYVKAEEFAELIAEDKKKLN
jgi:hypothetical protein